MRGERGTTPQKRITLRKNRPMFKTLAKNRRSPPRLQERVPKNSTGKRSIPIAPVEVNVGSSESWKSKELPLMSVTKGRLNTLGKEKTQKEKAEGNDSRQVGEQTRGGKRSRESKRVVNQRGKEGIPGQSVKPPQKN